MNMPARRRVRDGLELARLGGLLRVATIAFLALPLFIFVVGWLKAAVAFLLAVALVAVVADLIVEGVSSAGPAVVSDARVSASSLALALIPVAAVIAMSGAGGLGPGNWDWDKHAAILRDLVRQPWPVRYGVDGGSAGLTYYLGYHLPAAVVGKIAGWTAANATLALTSMIGAALALLWLVVLARGAPLFCSGLFVLFSGMDVLGAVVRAGGRSDIVALLRDPHLEWWAEHWQLSSNVALLDYAPHQALGGWLLTALVLDGLAPGRRPIPVATALALGLLWSPFVVLGLLPFLALGAFRRLKAEGSPRWLRPSAAVAGLALVAVLAAYFASRFAALALPACYRAEPAVAAWEGLALMPTRLGMAPFVAGYALFVTAEFLLLWVLLSRASRGREATAGERAALVVAGATLLALPVFHYGPYNDLVMRASIPSLFVLQVGVARTLRRSGHAVTTFGLIAVLCVGALHSANQLRKTATWMWRGRFLVRPLAEASVRDIFQIRLLDPPAARSGFAEQYLGSADALFFHHLARDSRPRQVAPCGTTGTGAATDAAAIRALPAPGRSPS